MTENKGKFLYGIHAVSNVISSDQNKVKKIYFKKNHSSKNLTNLLKKALDLSLYTEEVDLDRLTLMSESRRHQGVVCEINDEQLSSFNLDNYLLLTENPFILILDQIKDPNNLGACIRTANAAGCDLIVKRKSNSSPISPAVHKASCGGTSGMNIYESNDLNGIIKKLKSNNITIIGTDHRATHDYRQIDQLKHSGIGVILGSEDLGISRSLKKSCDIICSIPVHGNVDCLNISVACGVMLYEVAKYR